MFRRRYGANLAFMNVRIADGGAERFESVANALALVQPEADFVAIHDAVRPCVTDGADRRRFRQGRAKRCRLCWPCR